MDALWLLASFALAAVGVGLYIYFFYWFASKNRKIDVYVQPTVFKWPVETALLLSGTVTVLSVLQPVAFLGLFQMNLGFEQAFVIFVLFLPISLFLVLFGLVVYPGGFVLGWALLTLMGGLLFESLHLIYWSYVFGMGMIFLALFFSCRHAVDVLILRIMEAGDLELASHMRANSRIGVGSFLVCLLLPNAMFTRFVRRATKTGVVRVTVSLTPAGTSHRGGGQIWRNEWTTVNLERMSEDPAEVTTRIEYMQGRYRKRVQGF